MIPRLRIIAGPNGSGKSTLKSILESHLLGIYVNADDIEKVIQQTGYLDFNTYGVKSNLKAILRFFEKSTLSSKIELNTLAKNWHYQNGKLYINSNLINAYGASILAALFGMIF